MIRRKSSDHPRCCDPQRGSNICAMGITVLPVKPERSSSGSSWGYKRTAPDRFPRKSVTKGIDHSAPNASYRSSAPSCCHGPGCPSLARLSSPEGWSGLCVLRQRCITHCAAIQLLSESRKNWTKAQSFKLFHFGHFPSPWSGGFRL